MATATATAKKAVPAKKRASTKKAPTKKAPAKKAPAKKTASKKPAKKVPVSKAQAAADKRAKEKALAEELEAASRQVLAAAGVDAEVTWTEPPDVAPTAEIELTLDEEQPAAPPVFRSTAPNQEPQPAPVAQLPVGKESLTLSQELRAETAEIQRAIRLLQPEEAQALLDRIIPAREEIDALKAERLEEVGKITEAMTAIRGQIDRKLDQVKLAQAGESPQPVDPFRALGQIDRHWRRLGTLEDQRAELRKQYAAAIKDAERTYRAHLEGIRQRELPFGTAVA